MAIASLIEKEMFQLSLAYLYPFGLEALHLIEMCGFWKIHWGSERTPFQPHLNHTLGSHGGIFGLWPPPTSGGCFDPQGGQTQPQASDANLGWLPCPGGWILSDSPCPQRNWLWPLQALGWPNRGRWHAAGTVSLKVSTICHGKWQPSVAWTSQIFDSTYFFKNRWYFPNIFYQQPHKKSAFEKIYIFPLF